MAFKRVDSELEELRERIALSAFADQVLEHCLRERLSLRGCLDRFLSQVGERLGACGGVVLTRDEELKQAAFGWGELGRDDAWTLLSGKADGFHKAGARTIVIRSLDVAGTVVGQLGLVFDAPELPDVALERVACVAEELDAVLSTLHTAAEKQSLVEELSRALSNRVFEAGLDEAMRVLHRSTGFARLVFVWRDAVSEGLFYRMYRDGALEFHEALRHPGMEAAIAERGLELLAPGRDPLRNALGLDGALETVLVSGVGRADWLGKVLVKASGAGGFSTFALDLVRLMAGMARERLVDLNRERRHLGQFFPGNVISQLLRVPDYDQRLLRPRDERIAILYADINGFTRISERVLEEPSAIGRFIDGWSTGAVDIVWKHGGTFDKMVGDCIIGLFGPPFFEDPPERRALNALRAAREMLDFTIGYGDAAYREHLARDPAPGHEPGLGLAIGVNLTPACVGLFGPNQDYTAFSSGMNTTARLQTHAGFREILAMETVVEALRGVPEAAPFVFGPIDEAKAKNVSRPLRFARVERAKVE